MSFDNALDPGAGAAAVEAPAPPPITPPTEAPAPPIIERPHDTQILTPEQFRALPDSFTRAEPNATGGLDIWGTGSWTSQPVEPVTQQYGGGNGLTDQNGNVPVTGPEPVSNEPPPVDEMARAKRYQAVLAGLADPFAAAQPEPTRGGMVTARTPPPMSWDAYRAQYPNLNLPATPPMYGQIPEFAAALKAQMPAIPPDVLANNPQLARAVAAAYSAALASPVRPEDYSAWIGSKLSGAFAPHVTPPDAATQILRDALGKAQAPFQWFGENVADPLLGGSGLVLQALAAQPITVQNFAANPIGATVGAILRVASGNGDLPPNTTYQSLVWAANRRAQLMTEAGNPQDPISQARIDGQVAGEVWRGIAPTPRDGLLTSPDAQLAARANSPQGLAEPFGGAKGAAEMLNPAWLALGPLAKGAGAAARLLPYGEHAAPLIESYIANAGMPGMDRVLGAAFGAGLRQAKVGAGALRDLFGSLDATMGEGLGGRVDPAAYERNLQQGADTYASRNAAADIAGGGTAEGTRPRTAARAMDTFSYKFANDERGMLTGKDPNPGILSNVTDTAASLSSPGTTHEFTYKLVDANDLILSHHPNGVANAAYPEGVQPRARERVASQAQVDNIARNLDPNLLLSGGQIDRGTPITAPGSNVVESGNGRGAGVIKAITDYTPKYDAYRKALTDRAAEFGFTPDMVTGMQHPILVRERVGTTATSPKFAAEANYRTSLDMSPSEKAIQDAGRVHDNILSSLSVGENQSIDQALLSSENAHLRSAILSGIPETERASLADAQGNLNRDGLERIKAALFAKTFPGPEGQQLLNRFRESIDPGMKNIEAALFRSLPSVAKAEGLVRGAQRPADMALGQDLAAAVNELERIKATPGANVATEVAQLRSPALFAAAQTITPAQTRLIEILDQLANKPKQLTDFLRRYAELVDERGAQGTLMGGVASRDELIDEALAHASPKEAQMGLGLEGGERAPGLPTKEQLKAAGYEAPPSATANVDDIMAHGDSTYAGTRFGDINEQVESELQQNFDEIQNLQEQIDNEELTGKRLEKAQKEVGQRQGEYDGTLAEVEMAFGKEAADSLRSRVEGDMFSGGVGAVEPASKTPEERQPWQAADDPTSEWDRNIPPTTGMSEEQLVNEIGRLHEVGGDQRTIHAHEKALDAMRMPLVHDKGLEVHGEGHGNWYYVTKSGEAPNYSAHGNLEKNYMGPVMGRGTAIDMALTNDFVPGETPHPNVDRGSYSRALTPEQAAAEEKLVNGVRDKTQADQKALYASLNDRDKIVAHAVTTFQGDWHRIDELKASGASDEEILAFLADHDNIGGGSGFTVHLTSKGGYLEVGTKGAAGYEKITAKKLVPEVRRIFGINERFIVEHSKAMDRVVKNIDAEHAANPVKPAEPGEAVTLDGGPATVRGISKADGGIVYDVRSSKEPNVPHYMEEGALGRTSEGKGQFLSSHGMTGEAGRPHAGGLGDLEIKQQKNGKWIATRKGETSRNALFRADSREALIDDIRAKESRMSKNERTSAQQAPPPPIGVTSGSGRYHSAATGRYVVHTDGKIVDGSTGKVIQEKGNVNDARALADKMDREARSEKLRAGNLAVSEIPVKGGMRYGVRDDNTHQLVGSSFATRAEAEAEVTRRQTVGGRTAAPAAQAGATASTAAAAPKVSLSTPSEARAAAPKAAAAPKVTPEVVAKDELAGAMVDQQRIAIALSALPQERTSGMSHQVLAATVRRALEGPTAKNITGELLAQTDGIREALGIALKQAKLPSNRTNRVALADALIERERGALTTKANVSSLAAEKPTAEQRAVSGGLTSSSFQNVDIGKIVTDHLQPAGFQSVQAFSKALREGGDVSGVVDGVRDLFMLGDKERGLVAQGWSKDAAKNEIALERERIAKALGVEKGAPAAETPPPPVSSRVEAARGIEPPPTTAPEGSVAVPGVAGRAELQKLEDDIMAKLHSNYYDTAPNGKAELARDQLAYSNMTATVERNEKMGMTGAAAEAPKPEVAPAAAEAAPVNEDLAPPPNVEGAGKEIAAGIQKAAPQDAYAKLAQQMRDADPNITESEIKAVLGNNYTPPPRGPRGTTSATPPGGEGPRPRPNMGEPVGSELVHEDMQPNRIVRLIDLAKSNALSDPFAAIGRHTVQYAVGHPGTWLDVLATFGRAVKGIGRDDAGVFQSLAALQYDKAIKESPEYKWLADHGMNFWDASGAVSSERNDQWNSAMGERFPWIRLGHQDYATAVNATMLGVGNEYRAALEKAGMMTDEAAQTLTDVINHSVGSSHVPGAAEFRQARQAMEQLIAARTARTEGLTYDTATRSYRDLSGRDYSTTQLASQGASRAEKRAINVQAGAEAAMSAIRRILVSPRYTLSRFQTVGDMLRGLSTMVPGGRSLDIGPMRAVGAESAKVLQMHAVDMAKWYGAWLGMAQVLSMAGLADTSMDPRSSDFGSIRLKNGVRFDPFEGTFGTARLIAQSTFGQVDKNGKLIQPGQPGFMSPEQRTADYLTHRFSPVAGVLSDLAIHQTFGFKGLDLPTEALNLVTPGIAPRDIIQAVREGLSTGDTLWIAAFNTAGLNASKTGVKQQAPIGPGEIGGAAREGLRRIGITLPDGTTGPTPGAAPGVSGWQ